MEIYYYILFLLLLLSFLELVGVKFNPFFHIAVTVLLAVFLALRYKVGNDYISYEFIYSGIKEYGDFSYVEPVYIAICFLLPNFQYVIGFVSVLSMFFLYKIIVYYEARYFFVTLLAYFGAHFILYDIHLIRQGLSILIVVYAYRFVENNQFKKYFLYTLVAFGLHTSAIVAFSIPFVKKINLNSKNRIIIIITSVVMYIFLFFGRGVFFSILSVIPITARYANVYNNDEYSISYGLSLGLLLDILLFLYYNYRVLKLDQRKIFLLNILTLSIAISIAFNSFAVIFRMGYYFRVVNVFLLASLLYYIRPKLIIYLFICLYSYLYLEKSLTEGNGVRTLEYRNIITEEII